jgi:hypothetical protein
MMPAAPIAPPRLLYLPNEQVAGDQVGPRRAFEGMLERGQLAAYEAVSYLRECDRAGPAAAFDALADRAAALRPHWLLWQHLGGLALPRGTIGRLRSAAPGLRLLYHEGDLYGAGKPLPAATKALMREADVVALVGFGDFARRVRAWRPGPVLYTPSCADTQRFGRPRPVGQPPEFDVVMIGNRVRSRLPWRRLPGAAARAELARRLGRRFGRRFALFGQGWQGYAGWQGPLAYADQEAALRRARVSVGWNHFDREAGYFSDRLPISLLAGVAHVTNWQPGYEQVFGADPPLRWGRSVDEVCAEVGALLALAPPALEAIGSRAAELAKRQLVAEVVYPRLLAEAAAAVAAEPERSGGVTLARA